MKIKEGTWSAVRLKIIFKL